MRKLRFFLVIFIITLMTPQIVLTSSVTKEPQLIDVSTPSASLPRIYDMDVGAEIFELVDQDRYKSYVQDLTSFGPRHVYYHTSIPGSANELARYWLVDKMTELSIGTQ